MRKLIVPLSVTVAAMTAYACNKADFGSAGGKRRGSGNVLPAGGVQNPENPPVDAGADSGIPNGPKAGEGQDTLRVIDLDCDTAEGAVVEVSPPGKEPLPPFQPGQGLALGDAPVGVDGKPVGGKPDTGPDGKPVIPLPDKPRIDVPTSARVTAKVKGAFCPKAQHQLTVLFVVDYSGSMGRHVHDSGGPEVPGNDPQGGGTCGRLRAADAIVRKIMAERQPGQSVQIGMVPFAGGIVTRKVIPLGDVQTFAGNVNKDVFCQYVVQDASFGYDPANPGGIDGGAGGLLGALGGGVDSSTNYRAAFTAAETMLSNVYGRKVVYFISDGEPTSGGADPAAAGIEAGRRLRDQVDNLTLNALLLGNTGPAAQSVLEQVAGAPERVRRADNADELAREILAFPEASIDESTGRAVLLVAPYPAKDLGLRFLGRDPARAGVWIYETQPFLLLGIPGQEVLNEVEVTARGSDGSTYRSQVKIRYRQ